MLGLVGDIHGAYEVLGAYNRKAKQNPEIKAIIQLGDIGWYPYYRPYFNALNLEVPTYFVDGNHENLPELVYLTEVTEMAPNLFYVPRGTVLELDGRRVAFLGGAASVDKAWRTAGKDWFPEEQIRDSDIHRFDFSQPVDMLITHCPPQRVIQKHFNPHNLLMFGLPIDWRDPSADKVEWVWMKFGYPMVYSGHMHKSVFGENYRILDIDEVITV